MKVNKKFFITVAIFLLLVFCDQFSKYLIQKFLFLGQEVPIFSFLSLLYTHNKGIAFSFLSSAHPLFLQIFTVSMLLILLVLWFKTKPQDRLKFFALMLIIAGAVGNLIDRFYWHYVIDFIYFHIGSFFSFAIFNFADCFITIGAFLLILGELFFSKKSQNNKTTSLH